MIASVKNGIHDLSHKFPNNLRLHIFIISKISLNFLNYLNFIEL